MLKGSRYPSREVTTGHLKTYCFISFYPPAPTVLSIDSGWARSGKFWVYDKRNCTKVFMLKMGSNISVKMIFNDFEIICWEVLELFTDKVD